MYVCNCYGVTQNEIRELVDAGADTPEEIAADCGAGTGCGSCVGKIRALLDEAPAAHGKLALATASTADERRSPCAATGRSLNSSMSS